jgi:hypothetical protein
MHKYRILFQLLHLHVSIYMTLLRVLIGYISNSMCKVIYIYIHTHTQYDVKTEHPVMAKKLKFVKICLVC